MLPNTRSVRRSHLTNLGDKLLLDTAASQFLIGTLTRLRLLPLVRITPMPGDAYLFRGYRSIHTDEACDPDKARATALFHLAGPHAGTRLRAKLRRQPA